MGDSTFNKIKKLIENGNRLMFDVDITPKEWVLPNRAKFNHWIDTTFNYDTLSFNKDGAIKTHKSKSSNTASTKDPDEACNFDEDSLELFSHQKFSGEWSARLEQHVPPDSWECSDSFDGSSCHFLL